jgi:hypothetical protein
MMYEVKLSFTVILIAYLFVFAGCTHDSVKLVGNNPSEITQNQTESEVDSGSRFIQHGPCDLTGKWISTQRNMNGANYDQTLGLYILKQKVHSWAYWEFQQTGTQVVVTKELQCGSQFEITPQVPLVSGSTIAETQQVMEGLTTHSKMQGRQGVDSVQTGSSQCQLTIGQGAMVEGATYLYFKDFSHPLEEAKVRAQGTNPGWEDWDEDGSPGVTYSIGEGDLYIVRRDLADYRGSTEQNATKFKLNVNSQRQQLVISANPTGVEWPKFAPLSDQKENFIWFARVDGAAEWDIPYDSDDLTICAQTRLTKNKLIPEGDK